MTKRYKFIKITLRQHIINEHITIDGKTFNFVCLYYSKKFQTRFGLKVHLRKNYRKRTAKTCAAFVCFLLFDRFLLPVIFNHKNTTKKQFWHLFQKETILCFITV